MSLSAALVCSNFARSLRFYTDVLGFTTMRYEPAARRAELERDGVAICIAEAEAATGMLEYPFGRGVTLVVWTAELEAVYAGVQAYGARVFRAVEEVRREEDGQELRHLAFEVLDPDGYALRFCQPLRPGA